MRAASAYSQFLSEIWLAIQPSLRHLFEQFLLEQHKLMQRHAHSLSDTSGKQKWLAGIAHITQIQDRWLSEFLDEVATSAFGVADLKDEDIDDATQQKISLYDQVIKASHRERLGRIQLLQQKESSVLWQQVQSILPANATLEDFPLAPKPLLRCFLASLDSVDVCNDFRQLLFDCFETEVLSHSVNLYRHLEWHADSKQKRQKNQWDQTEALQGVVTLVFDYILENAPVHPKLQLQIRRLQSPLVDSVRTDKSFLTRKQHPARKLIKEVCELCLDHDPDKDFDGQAFLQALTQIIDELLEAYKGNANVFVDARSSLHAYIQKHLKKLYPVLEEPGEDGKGIAGLYQDKATIELNEYEAYVCTIINRILENYDLSQPVSQFIIESWSWVMNALLEREGADGQNFIWSLHVLHNIANIFHQDRSGVQSMTAEGQFNQLVQDIQTGFNFVAFSHTRKEKTIRMLEQEYSSLQDEKSLDLVMVH